jgi:hypothetical protein
MRNTLIAVVLPPGEVFAPAAAGPVGLEARRLALQPSAFRPLVLGAQVETPFADVAFRPVQPPWMLAGALTRYAAGVAQALAGRVPALVEVHNLPELALALADRLPAPVMLVQHTDPQEMRRARTPAERLFLVGTLARIVTLSAELRDRLLDGLHETPRQVHALPEGIHLDAVRGDVVAAWAAGEAAPV